MQMTDRCSIKLLETDEVDVMEYKVVSSLFIPDDSDERITVYGIKAFDSHHTEWFPDVSDQYELVELLQDRLQRGQPAWIHLRDIIEDFLVECI